jgi:hypothetical protein
MLLALEELGSYPAFTFIEEGCHKPSAQQVSALLKHLRKSSVDQSNIMHLTTTIIILHSQLCGWELPTQASSVYLLREAVACSIRFSEWGNLHTRILGNRR